jgi:hypothetical protein
LGLGEYFGEMSIFLETYRSLDVIAHENCTLYAISVETLRAMLGEKYKDVLFLNCIKNCFQQSKFFKKLGSDFIESSFPSFKVVNIAKGKVVIKEGTVSSANIIVVLQGNIIDVYIIVIILEQN